MQESEAYRGVDQKWKATCRSVLGGEIGGLCSFSEWLYQYCGPRSARESEKGEEVILSLPHHSPNSRFIAHKDVDFGKKPPLLSINEIKDIDSIVESLRERFLYTGSIVLGNSRHVADSTNIIDSFYVVHSERIAHSKHIGYCSFCTYGECVFGSNGFGSSSFIIKCNGASNCTRSFELHKCDFSSGCYYSHGLSGCTDCMFCFHLKGRRASIGNLQLSASKYREAKSKLLSELREMLQKEKSAPTLLEIAGNEKPSLPPILQSLEGKVGRGTGDKSAAEKGFAKATKLLFGEELSPMGRYGKWLARHTTGQRKARSCASGLPVLLPGYSNFLLFPKNRLLTLDEAELAVPRLAVSEKFLDGISIENAPSAIGEIAYFCPDWQVGECRNNPGCPLNVDSSDCCNSILNVESKACAYSYLPRESESIFGVNETRESSFSINCYHSGRIRRSFEIDASNDCSDSYFLHNCENTHSSMFCFNAKNLKNAIGNSPLPREAYLKIRDKVKAELLEKIKENKGLPFGIFTLFSR
jgi:hypothetical protein